MLLRTPNYFFFSMKKGVVTGKHMPRLILLSASNRLQTPMTVLLRSTTTKIEKAWLIVKTTKEKKWTGLLLCFTLPVKNTAGLS